MRVCDNTNLKILFSCLGAGSRVERDETDRLQENVPCSELHFINLLFFV